MRDSYEGWNRVPPDDELFERAAQLLAKVELERPDAGLRSLVLMLRDKADDWREQEAARYGMPFHPRWRKK